MQGLVGLLLADDDKRAESHDVEDQIEAEQRQGALSHLQHACVSTHGMQAAAGSQESMQAHRQVDVKVV